MPIIHYNDYKRVVTDVLDKVPVLRVDQLATIIMRYAEVLDDEVDRDTAQSILIAVQRNGYVLMNEDGWAMTKSAHLQMTNGKFSENISHGGAYRIADKLERIKYQENNKRTVTKVGTVDAFLSRKRLDDINAMWVVADMYPDSEGFTKGCEPFNFVFIQNGEPADEENGLEAVPSICYEIIYISKENENATIAMLEALPKIKNKEMQNSIKRVVILEDARHAWKVPYVGVSHICALDPDSDIHYEIIETRTDEERWRDVNV